MAGYWGSAGEVSMRHAAAIALMMSLPFAAAMADVYRSVDAQGHVQYSDTPTPGAELVHLQKLGIPSAAPSSAPPAGGGRPLTELWHPGRCPDAPPPRRQRGQEQRTGPGPVAAASRATGSATGRCAKPRRSVQEGPHRL